MSKLRRVENSQFARFEGYIDAAQHIFRNKELEVTLEAALFDLIDKAITDEEVVREAYGGEFNPIEYRSESTVELMKSKVNALLTLSKSYFKPPYGYVELIQENVRQGYWKLLEECFDYKRSRVIELGHHVPYVNMGARFTYILYAPDMSRCMLLVGNTSD